MDRTERADRAARLRRAVLAQTAADWLDQQLAVAGAMG
jgi:hypothetical protein